MQAPNNAPAALSDFLKLLRDSLRRAFPETYWVTGETAGIKAQTKVSAFIGEGINVIRSFEKLAIPYKINPELYLWEDQRFNVI